MHYIVLRGITGDVFDKWEPLNCVAMSDGGCPCPYNQVKCGLTEFYPGYCSDVCCDLTVEGEISWYHEIVINAKVGANATSFYCF
jgi:hypothetical protein